MDEQRQYILNYLEKNKFGKQLKKLSKKLKGKRVVLYGAGLFFEVLNSAYDLSVLNVVAISDKKFDNVQQGEIFLGYNAIPPAQIEGTSPDIVLVTTEKFINIIDYLTFDLLDKTNIKVKPILKLPFVSLFKLIWNS